ncbi:MAG: Fic family protein [Desulfobulbaceae bacterium]|nr:Fic family protein [Desulfobulbaceae bacterium]
MKGGFTTHDKKKWNWQKDDWTIFTYDNRELEEFERYFSKQSGFSLGITRHLSSEDQSELIVELVCNEALNTSEIEGEFLDRESLQSSIRREFGMGVLNRHNVKPAEAGIAEMMKDIFSNYDSTLTETVLCNWHEMLMSGRRNIEIGKYRTHKEAMQVVSGRYDKPKIHFEAPPSADVPKEMEKFIKWFNKSAPDGKEPLTPLIRAGIAHIYFVSIHPFEDGNGRIGRGIVEKSLSQNMGQPTLIALSSSINDKRRDYYQELATQSTGNDITKWLIYFSKTIIDAQKQTIKQVDFIITKAKFFDTHKENLNPRQLKVINRILEEGPKGFDGGFSAKNYRAITKSPAATATRDLQDLVSKGIFSKTGQLKSTRYTLDLFPFQG